MNDNPSDTGGGETSGQASAMLRLLAAGRQIAVVVGTSTVLAVAVSFLLPKWYDSTTTLLPPKNQSGVTGFGGVTSLLKDFIPMSAAKGLQQSGAYSYLALLNSRREKEAIIGKFDLIRVYDVADSSMADALKEFEMNYDVSVADDGSIGITISDRDSVRAAQMANFAVTVLNVLNAELGATESRGNREFLEKRVGEFRDSLERTEETLRAYQEKHGLVVLSGEEKSSATAYVNLYAKRVEADIELSVLRKTVGPDNPIYEQKKLAYDELTERLDKFPRMGMESLRLFRQLLINQKILEILLPLYEQAKFEEVKDVPAVVVLDPAVPAERKSRPIRSLVVLTAFATSMAFCVLYILGRDRLNAIFAQRPEIRSALGALVRRSGSSRRS